MPNRIATVLLLLGLLVSSCARQPATPTRSATIRFFDISNLDVRDIPMLMALDDLRSQGYHVETTYLASSSLIAEALARGDADLALLNNLTMWSAIAKGVDARTIVEPVAPTTMLVAQSAITHCSRLNGLGVGVASATGLSPARLERYFQLTCPGTVPTYVVISESSGRTAGLLSDNLAAALLPVEELFRLEQDAPGRVHILADMAAIFPGVRQDGVHARAAWARENPQVVQDVLKALLNANRKVMANPTLLTEEAVKRLELDPVTARAIVELHLAQGVWDANGGLTAERVQSTLDFLVEIGSLKSGQTVSDVADLSYLEAVLREVGRR
jgi:ABC-type nitrate/sulfonate/bicarbonate transport system substrate-binding protein